MTDLSDPTRMMARFVLTTGYDDLDADLVRHVKRSIVDSIGVALGGLDHPASQMLLRHVRELGGTPQATVWGATDRLTVPQAALVNGYLVHVLDYDDTYLQPDILLHANAPLLPAALGVAEWRRRSGRDLMAAFAVGYELEARLTLALGRDERRSWPTTTVCGIVAATAAAAKLLGLDETQLCHALGIAGAQASGSSEVFGSDAKALQPGYAAQKGVDAALLAARGFTSTERMFEDRRGCFFRLYSESPNIGALERLGERWELRLAAFKAFACGIVAQPFMDGVIQLRNKYAITPESVEAIEARVNPYTTVPMGNLEPRTGLEGKFSVWHAAAVVLVDGTAGKLQFTDSRVNDPVVLSVGRRVKVETDPTVMPHEAHVTIRLTDGRKYDLHVEHGKGTRLNPLTDDDLREKFTALAEPVVGSEQASRALELIERLDVLEDAGDLARATVPELEPAIR